MSQFPLNEADGHQKEVFIQFTQSPLQRLAPTSVRGLGEGAEVRRSGKRIATGRIQTQRRLNSNLFLKLYGLSTREAPAIHPSKHLIFYMKWAGWKRDFWVAPV